MIESAPALGGAAVLIALLLLLPHLMPLHRVAPARAARVWMLSLAVRALLIVGGVVLSLLVLPSSPPFQNLAGATWHRLVPLVPDDVDLSLDPLAHFAVLAPALAVTGSIALFAVLARRLTKSTRHHMRVQGLGDGPQGSLVMADPGVYIALASARPQRVLISTGALSAMDDEELAAGLAHEDGHEQCGHRRWTRAGGVLAAAARPLPGTRACTRGLDLSLERQADEWAVAATRNPLALAGAICKAAATLVPRGALGLGSSATSVRLGQLLGDERSRSTARAEFSVDALAGVLAGVAAILACAVVAAVVTEPSVLGLAVTCSIS